MHVVRTAPSHCVRLRRPRKRQLLRTDAAAAEAMRLYFMMLKEGYLGSGLLEECSGRLDEKDLHIVCMRSRNS